MIVVLYVLAYRLLRDHLNYVPCLFPIFVFDIYLFFNTLLYVTLRIFIVYIDSNYDGRLTITDRVNLPVRLVRDIIEYFN